MTKKVRNPVGSGSSPLDDESAEEAGDGAGASGSRIAAITFCLRCLKN